MGNASSCTFIQLISSQKFQTLLQKSIETKDASLRRLEKTIVELSTASSSQTQTDKDRLKICKAYKAILRTLLEPNNAPAVVSLICQPVDVTDAIRLFSSSSSSSSGRTRQQSAPIVLDLCIFGLEVVCNHLREVLDFDINIFSQQNNSPSSSSSSSSGADDRFQKTEDDIIREERRDLALALRHRLSAIEVCGDELDVIKHCMENNITPGQTHQIDRAQVVKRFVDGVDINAALVTLNIHPSDVIKCMLAANAGIGKSWLLNLLCGKVVFISKAGAAGVTVDAQSVLIKHPSLQGKYLLILDVPGLIELADEAVERNRKVIGRALKEILPNSPTALIFIFGAGQGGRLTDGDRQAFTAFTEYIKISPDNFVTVVNKFPAFEDEAERDRARCAYAAYIKTVVNAKTKPHFIQNMSRASIRDNFNHPMTITVAERFAVALELAIERATVLSFDPNAELQLEKHKMLQKLHEQQQRHKEELKKLEADQEAAKREFEKEEREIQARIEESRRRKSSC